MDGQRPKVSRWRRTGLFLTRLAVLIVVVASSPVVVFSFLWGWERGAVVYAVQAAAMYPAGMFVGWLKRDGKYEFGFAGTYALILGGAVIVLMSLVTDSRGDAWIGAAMLAAAVPPFAAGTLGVMRTRGVQERRRRAGECVMCGYALEGLGERGNCPECGAGFERASGRPARELGVGA